MGVFSDLQNNSGNLHHILLSRCFREELKQRIWGKACPGKARIGSYSVTSSHPNKEGPDLTDEKQETQRIEAKIAKPGSD